MFIATIVVSTLLAAALVYAAARKLTHREDVVRSYTRVGVPEERLDYLAYTLLAGAGGLLLGLWFAPIGIAAATALVAYFLAAIAAHIRSDDSENLPTPVMLELMAAAALVLQLAAL